MSTEYIEINSAFRNRVEYPLASDFVVRPAESGAKPAAQAVDPYSLAAPTIGPFQPFVSVCGTVAAGQPGVPYFGNSSEGTTLVLLFAPGVASHVANYYSGAVLFGGTTPLARISLWEYAGTSGGQDMFQVVVDTTIAAGTAVCVLDPTDLTNSTGPILFLPAAVGSANTDNYYIDEIVYNQTRNEWLPIFTYDGTSHTAFLSLTGGQYTPGTWQLTDTYIVRPQAPIQAGQSLTVLSSTTAQIVPLAAPIVGSFLRLTANNETYRVVGYNAGVVTVNPAFTEPVGSVLQYEVLQFTADNEGYLIFNNSSAAIRESVCYDVSLLSLILPSQTLTVGNGSRSIFYPYFYVEFRSLKTTDGPNTLVSNNPNARRALFRTTITDYPDALLNPFIRLTGDGMTQRIKLDPLGSFRFRVFLPDGSLFQTITPESYSPARPNRIGQITALFSLKRVPT